MKRMFRTSHILAIGIVLLAGGSWAQEPAAPLPEYEQFLRETRQKLHSDRALLSQYTYIEKSVEKTLDGSGNVKKIEEEVREIYPSVIPELSYERLILRNGKPVSAKELEKSDREHDKKVEDYERRLQRERKSAREERLAKEAEARRKEEAILEELFQLYRIDMLRREMMEEQPAILFEFRPRPDFKPKTDAGKILEKVAGRAWVSENDHEIIRVEAELIDNYTIGGGILARLNKGASFFFRRRKVNDVIWLPAEAHFEGSARIMLFKGMRVDWTSQISDYKQFTAETNIIFRRDKNPQ